MSFKISSDSTCDLSPEIVKENDITIIPLTILLDGKEYHDNVDITSEKVINFVESSKNAPLPKTAAVPVETYIDYFKKLTADGSEVIHFDISSEDSSCYDHALAASKEVGGVYVVDTRQLSSGQGLVVMKAVDLRKEGKSAKEAFDYIEKWKTNVRTSFVVDRLDFLHKGGRCSLLALLGAKLLKIHPYISMTNGSLGVKKKYTGTLMRSVTQYVTDLAAEYGEKYDKNRCFITHCFADKEIFDAVKAKVEELFDFEEIIETHAGTTVTSHCGRNTIGVLISLND